MSRIFNKQHTHTHTYQNQKEMNPQDSTKKIQKKTPVDGKITYSSDRWKIEFKLQKYANSVLFFTLFFQHFLIEGKDSNSTFKER